MRATPGSVTERKPEQVRQFAEFTTALLLTSAAHHAYAVHWPPTRLGVYAHLETAVKGARESKRSKKKERKARERYLATLARHRQLMEAESGYCSKIDTANGVVVPLP